MGHQYGMLAIQVDKITSEGENLVVKMVRLFE